MGYKLAGYDVLGGVEIDPQMMSIYKENHHPAHSFLMGVEEFNKIPNNEFPKELFNLDILDGSPPCSSFSLAGARDKAWGEKKQFREGQTTQILDDLFFKFIETAQKLQPKIVIAENVKGLIIGKAKGYVKQIAQAFDLAGYNVQLFLLNAAFMGVPQRRERVFFIAHQKKLELSELKLQFSEQTITTKQAIADINLNDQAIKKATLQSEKLWQSIKPGESFSKAHHKGSRFNEVKLNPNLPANTINASSLPWHWESPRRITGAECIRIQSFPEDFNFLNQQTEYVCGMSVPPFMMQRIALQIESQWLGTTNGNA